MTGEVMHAIASELFGQQARAYGRIGAVTPVNAPGTLAIVELDAVRGGLDGAAVDGCVGHPSEQPRDRCL
jgi:hypothetical protein